MLRNHLRRDTVWHKDSDDAKRLAVQDCLGAAFLHAPGRWVVPEACGTVWGIRGGRDLHGRRGPEGRNCCMCLTHA